MLITFFISKYKVWIGGALKLLKIDDMIEQKEITVATLLQKWLVTSFPIAVLLAVIFELDTAVDEEKKPVIRRLCYLTYYQFIN